jgi:hypothetical protein
MIAPLPSSLGPTVGTAFRGGSAGSLERRSPSRYDKAMTDLLNPGDYRPFLAMAQRAEAALA